MGSLTGKIGCSGVKVGLLMPPVELLAWRAAPLKMLKPFSTAFNEASITNVGVADAAAATTTEDIVSGVVEGVIAL